MLTSPQRFTEEASRIYMNDILLYCQSRNKQLWARTIDCMEDIPAGTANVYDVRLHTNDTDDKTIVMHAN
jgi:hypothetical protein